MKPPEIQSMDRRSFLKLLGAASAATTASLVMPGGLGAPGLVRDLFDRHDFKIGLLLPTSENYPEMGGNFLDGMETHFSSSSLFHPSIVVEHVPDGYVGAAGRARKLVEHDRVDLVVAGVSSQVAPVIRDVLDESRTPFVISNTGASPISPTSLGDYGLHNSLGLWQSSWGAGDWAGKNIGKKAVVVTTLADSGNASTYSFQLGLEQAGGTLVETLYADAPVAAGQQGVIDRIAAARPDFVYAIMSGTAGREFLDDYDRWGLPPVVASGFMAEGSALPHSASAAGLLSTGTWADALHTDANVSFTNTYRQHTGRQPDQFAVLGFETALFIDEAAGNLNGRMGNSGRVLAALSSSSIAGPRGLVTFDKATRSSTVPLYLRESRSTLGSWRNVVLGELPAVKLTDAADAGVMAAAKSGLLNEFMCC